MILRVQLFDDKSKWLYSHAVLPLSSPLLSFSPLLVSSFVTCSLMQWVAVHCNECCDKVQEANEKGIETLSLDVMVTGEVDVMVTGEVDVLAAPGAE